MRVKNAIKVRVKKNKTFDTPLPPGYNPLFIMAYVASQGRIVLFFIAVTLETCFSGVGIVLLVACNASQELMGLDVVDSSGTSNVAALAGPRHLSFVGYMAGVT
jgi:hypothetical protein